MAGVALMWLVWLGVAGVAWCGLDVALCGFDVALMWLVWLGVALMWLCVALMWLDVAGVA